MATLVPQRQHSFISDATWHARHMKQNVPQKPGHTKPEVQVTPLCRHYSRKLVCFREWQSKPWGLCRMPCCQSTLNALFSIAAASPFSLPNHFRNGHTLESMYAFCSTFILLLNDSLKFSHIPEIILSASVWNLVGKSDNMKISPTESYSRCQGVTHRNGAFKAWRRKRCLIQILKAN